MMAALEAGAGRVYLTPDRASVKPGDTVEISVSVEGVGVTALQWEERASAAIHTASRSTPYAEGKDLHCRERRCVLYGMNRDPIPAGRVATWTIAIPYAASRGVIAIQLGDVLAADSEGAAVEMEDVPSATLEVTEDGVPQFESESVTDAATFRAGLAVGGLASVFGRGLSAISGTIPLAGALDFRGLSVRVNGLAAPLLSVTVSREMEQVNFQVPFEVAEGQADIEIRNHAGQFRRVPGVPIYAARPAIFDGAVVHPDGSVVTPAHPAARGETISIYWTGGGPVSPAAGTGNPGPIPPARLMLPAKAYLDGVSCRITFAGYAPHLLGVYQMNLEVPAVSAIGTAAFTIEIDGVMSSPIAIPVE